eukprot:XP_020395469.1 uncharacterized protein LOC103629069 [Zea mays]
MGLLLHALDRRVWEVKVSAIIESPNYETLTVDELFSKLKSTEIDHQTRAKIENSGAPTMALVSGGGSASNPSPVLFALSSLLTITEDQVESLGDEELALVASRFTRFHNNRMSRRCGGSKDGCYNCGDPDHFVASCPKKGKLEAGPRDHHSGRRKGKRDTSSKHKSKGGFDKEALQRKYRQKAKIKERAFLASLSDLDHDSDESASASSDEEVERHIEDKLNGLYFFADTAGGLCTMALGENAVGTSNDKDIGDDTTSEVLPSADDLAAEVEELTTALASQDKLLRQAARDRREFRSKYESTLRELESARASVVVSDETECDEYALHMSNITTLQTKYATLLDERDELRSRSSLLDACTVCPSLQTELAERDARIALLEKASSDGGLENTWFMDSGCSRHTTGSSKWFSSLDLVISKEYITFGDKSSGKVVSRGTIRVNESFVLKDAALVSNLHFNLLSVSQPLEDDFEDLPLLFGSGIGG